MPSLVLRPARPVRTVLVGAATAVVLLLAGCAGTEAPTAAPTATSPAAGSADALVAAEGFAGLSGRDVVDRLEAVPVADRDAGLLASVRPDALLLTGEDGAEASLPLPDDAFYLSVAPYVDQTHECFFHSLTTCLGELRDEEVAVTVVDADGAVLVDETVRTQDNGFIGLWLPRGLEGATLTVEHDGRSVTTPVGTGAQDPTCLTTLQLA